jgi:ribonuclease HI
VKASKAHAKHSDKDTARAQAFIYTVGGCLINPGWGGWAAIIYEGPRAREISGFERETTNNRMGLMATKEALIMPDEPSSVRLFSDSAYLVDGFEKGWVHSWERNGWKNAHKRPVKNRDLWSDLLELSRFHKVKFVKVARHAGYPREREVPHPRTARNRAGCVKKGSSVTVSLRVFRLLYRLFGPGYYYGDRA